MADNMPQLMSVAELSDLIGLKPRTIMEYVRRGKIPGAVKLSPQKTRFRVDVIRQWIEDNTVKTAD